MGSPAKIVVAASGTVVLGVLTLILLPEGAGFLGVLPTAMAALAFFVLTLAWTDHTMGAGTRPIGRSLFLGCACVLFGVSLALQGFDIFADSGTSPTIGIALGVVAIWWVGIGGGLLTGRIEPPA